MVVGFREMMMETGKADAVMCGVGRRIGSHSMLVVLVIAVQIQQILHGWLQWGSGLLTELFYLYPFAIVLDQFDIFALSDYRFALAGLCLFLAGAILTCNHEFFLRKGCLDQFFCFGHKHHHNKKNEIKRVHTH